MFALVKRKTLSVNPAIIVKNWGLGGIFRNHSRHQPGIGMTYFGEMFGLNLIFFAETETRKLETWRETESSILGGECFAEIWQRGNLSLKNRKT
jgi:hypothetical protein